MINTSPIRVDQDNNIIAGQMKVGRLVGDEVIELYDRNRERRRERGTNIVRISVLDLVKAIAQTR